MVRYVLPFVQLYSTHRRPLRGEPLHTRLTRLVLRTAAASVGPARLVTELVVEALTAAAAADHLPRLETALARAVTLQDQNTRIVTLHDQNTKCEIARLEHTCRGISRSEKTCYVTDIS